MLALIVALFWLAILAPWAVIKFRNSRSEKSIDSFQAEHEVLSRQNYSVTPARRLGDAYLYEEHAYEPGHEPSRSRPYLTVVQDDDTYSSLESRLSWDEWERDYDYDQPHSLSSSLEHGRSRYSAYASSPTTTQGPYAHSPEYEPDYASVEASFGASMKLRRNRIVASLGVSALVTTGLNFLIGLSLMQYLAVLSWVALALYLAAALFAVSLGYLEVSSLLGRRSTTADELADVDAEPQGRHDETYPDEAYEEFADDQEWRREPRRHALG
jgi:hypothetical protein